MAWQKKFSCPSLLQDIHIKDTPGDRLRVRSLHSFSTDQQKGHLWSFIEIIKKNLYNWINQWLQSSRIIHSKFLGNFWCLNLFNHFLDRSFLSETALLGWDSCGGNWSSAPAIDAKPGSKTRRSINNLSLHGYDMYLSSHISNQNKPTSSWGFAKFLFLVKSSLMTFWTSEGTLITDKHDGGTDWNWKTPQNMKHGSWSNFHLLNGFPALTQVCWVLFQKKWHLEREGLSIPKPDSDLLILGVVDFICPIHVVGLKPMWKICANVVLLP